MKIMIVEDDRTIRDMVAESVEKWGYSAIKVEQFDDVLALHIHEKPELVLMDINLPLYDGYYWCSRIREVSKVPMIFLSSRSTPIDMVMAMNMGGDDYIQKPFHTDVLMAKVNALLRRTYSYLDKSTTIMEREGVVLNLNDGTVMYEGLKAELTRNEHRILRLIMEHSGTTVSRNQIMRALWEDESFVDDNTLTVNMTRLRKKIEELGKEDFILTKKGEGYLIR